jgi:hypothetical protein
MLPPAIYQVLQPVIPLAGTTITANSASQYTIGTQTLIPGGTAIKISGTLLSLAPSATAVVLGGSRTIRITSPPASVYATPLPTRNGTASHTASAQVYNGTAVRRRYAEFRWWFVAIITVMVSCEVVIV